MTSEPLENRYQQDAKSSQSLSEPVRLLHNQALAAINESQFQQASDYLQRAIKIEPRNSWSWYYLADVHWRQGQFDRCRSMLDRADAYQLDDSQLQESSRRLRARCR